MKSNLKYFAPCLLVLLTQAAFAAQPGGGSSFTVLSAAPNGGGAVTCTDSIITGVVGSSGQPASVTQTNCTINGAVVAPVSAGVLSDFESGYKALASVPYHNLLTGTLAGVTLSPGVYCFDAAAALTGTLTLNGGLNDTWLIKIGNGAVGALTGTNFDVVMTGGATACNVTWWVDAAATMTTSHFLGTIYAGAAITFTGSAAMETSEGQALARAGVTLTGVNFVGCEGSSAPAKGKCNQGVGNGPEACDPGNSNQGNPFRSNDELGGVPGTPGRQGGNK